MRLQFSKLQEVDKKAKALRAACLLKDWKNVKGVLQYRRLLYVPESIRSKVISHYHNNLFIGHFGIDKTRELVGRKYYWPSLKKDVKSYVQGCDVCLALKAVKHKPYGDLQSLPIPTHWWKDLSMDFVTRLLLSSDWKSNSYNSILVIVDRLTKMVHYKSVKVIINAPELAEVIINCDATISRSSRLHYKQPESDFYIQVLVPALLLPRHQVTTLHHVLPLDWQTDGTTK